MGKQLRGGGPGVRLKDRTKGDQIMELERELPCVIYRVSAQHWVAARSNTVTHTGICWVAWEPFERYVKKKDGHLIFTWKFRLLFRWRGISHG